VKVKNCFPFPVKKWRKKRNYAALKLFNENIFELKERLKSVYFAMMLFLKDDCPDGYKKMGEELKQTVEEII